MTPPDYLDDFVFRYASNEEWHVQQCRRHSVEDRRLAREIVSLIRQYAPRRSRLATRIESCGAHNVRFVRESPRRSTAFRTRCKEKPCPSCSRWELTGYCARRYRYLGDAPTRDEVVIKLDLTQRDRRGESLAMARRRFKASWERFLNRAACKRFLRGALLRIEWTWKDGAWHLHGHGVCLVDPALTPEVLKRLWKEASPSAQQVVVEVVAPHDVGGPLNYMGEPQVVVGPELAAMLRDGRSKHRILAAGSLRNRLFPERKAAVSVAREGQVLTLVELRNLARSGDPAAAVALEAVSADLARRPRRRG